MFKILLVEDDAGFRKTLREMLLEEFPSLEISEAVTGDEALRLVRLACPSFIFMDIRLPGRNGFDVMKEIKAFHPDVPVVILTSYDFPEYREAAFRHGAEHFLVKGTTRRESILALVSAGVRTADECRKGTAANTERVTETKKTAFLLTG